MNPNILPFFFSGASAPLGYCGEDGTGERGGIGPWGMGGATNRPEASFWIVLIPPGPGPEAAPPL